jgi:plastocyanin
MAALVMALLAVMTVAVACGGDDEEGNGDATPTEAADATEAASPTRTSSPTSAVSPTEDAGGAEVELELAAENIAYDLSELSAPAGASVRLVFDNDDEGIPHNFSLYESAESEDPLFAGDVITGVDSVNYEFPAPAEPGTYHFHCDIHPTQMTGDFIVE